MQNPILEMVNNVELKGSAGAAGSRSTQHF
jgi:hypothetical protein